MKINYFFDKGQDVMVCFRFNRRTYIMKCNWAGNKLAFRILKKYWYSEHRAIRLQGGM